MVNMADMSGPDLSIARNLLETHRIELQQQLHDLENEGPGAPDFDDNFADSAQVAAEQGETASLVSQLSEQVSEIDAALERMDAGTYGTCEVCGKPIGDARLEALPSTRYCIHDASAAV